MKQVHGGIFMHSGWQGEKDDAAPNGRDDFKRINHVPVVLATYPSVGHTATYQDHQGGAFGQMARTWLDYQLKGKKQYENLFRYRDKGNDFEGWEITQKGFDKMQTMRLYNEIMPDNEVVKTNDIMSATEMQHGQPSKSASTFLHCLWGSKARKRGTH
jgi:hypothetical protein